MPELSVVVPSVNSFEDLSGCLESLRLQQGVLLEIIVVDRLGAALRESVDRDFPEVVLIPTDRETSIPQMRALAFGRASAPAIAVIEDHVIVPPHWGRQLLDALAEGSDVVGGSVENAATETLTDWASFLCEYSGSLPPIPRGEVTSLPGNNVVYRRQLLNKYWSVVNEGKWENRLHDAMRADGIKLVSRPEIVVGHKMHYTVVLYVSQRYLYARSYAGARVQGASLLIRLAYGAAAACLPPVLLYRTVRRVLVKRRYRGYLVASLPLLGVFVTSWGVGEMVGYWFGGGRALFKVR